MSLKNDFGFSLDQKDSAAGVFKPVNAGSV